VVEVRFLDGVHGIVFEWLFTLASCHGPVEGLDAAEDAAGARIPVRSSTGSKNVTAGLRPIIGVSVASQSCCMAAMQQVH
jgi:hypothetical protein